MDDLRFTVKIPVENGLTLSFSYYYDERVVFFKLSRIHLPNVPGAGKWFWSDDHWELDK